MREIYRNPMLYYLLAPVLVAIWPVLVVAVYLPAAQRNAQNEQSQCVQGQSHILDILKYDPERLKFVDNQDISGEFSYPKAIERVATLCHISSTNYNYTTGSMLTTKDKKSQGAKVFLTGVSIVPAATFLSQMQSMWVNLKCSKITLTKKKGARDVWDVDLDFWYTY